MTGLDLLLVVICAILAGQAWQRRAVRPQAPESAYDPGDSPYDWSQDGRLLVVWTHDDRAAELWAAYFKQEDR